MSAFERVKCGIPALDAVYDNIRLGDNVVWQLSRLEDFALIMRPFVEQAKLDGRNINYIRFASHAELLPEQPGVNRHELDPGIGFERFTVQVRSIITKEGRDAFYVFDSLSDLQVAWSSDLMMGNFFRVTCPYLFELDTVAYFPILRGRHSFAAVAKIRETTQLFTDVFSECVADGPSQQSGTENGALPSRLFIHPLKVWNRSSATMFLPHSFNIQTGAVEGLTDGVGMSRFYAQKEAEESGDASEDEQAGQAEEPFEFNAHDWAKPELTEADGLGLIPTDLRTADLTQPITRAEFAAVSVKVYEALSGLQAEPAAENPFTDTSDPEVLKALNVGITNGLSETEFAPDKLLNREQAATMLSRVYKKVAFDGWTLGTDGDFAEAFRALFTMPEAFTDDADISSWARDSVYFMAANGILKGMEGGTFQPRAVTEEQQIAGYAQATREQAILIAVRLVKNLGT